MPEAAADGAAGQQQQQRGGSNLLATILRMAFMWYVMNWMKGGQQGGKDAGPLTKPVFGRGDLFDMYAFVSESPYPQQLSWDQPIWVEKAVQFATDAPRASNYTYIPSTAVQNNGSVYLHVAFVNAGLPVDPNDSGHKPNTVWTKVQSLVSYRPRPKEKTGVNLLSGEGIPVTEETKQAEQNREIISFWKPNMTVSMVDHFQPYQKKQIPQQLFDHMMFSDEGDYYPLVHFDEFWLLRDKLVMINETVSNLTLHLELKPISFWWWQLQLQIEQSFKMQVNTGLQQDGESDEFKRVLLEGNPYLLALTFTVSLLHSFFDFLAFKNDIGFWKDNKSMEGLSARSITLNAFCQLVIFLYLLDNETSFVVIISSGVGTAIEFWKVTKAMDVTFSTSYPFISAKDRSSYVTSKTKQYDQEASRYLSYVLYPLIIGYSIYSLYYDKHKSWYSWVLGSLVGAVYTFGFILMCPQLYLNYKLKSVAHLPWRQMTYKFLNTIIDDLFAFVIKMPLLHRLSVFRDDIIFLIYLYQRWIYRVDKTRANEFGWVEADADKQQQVEGAKDEAPAIEGSSSEGKKKRKDAKASREGAAADAGTSEAKEGKKDS